MKRQRFPGMFGITWQYVWYILKTVNIKAQLGGRVKCYCCFCGKEAERFRSSWCKRRRNFCSPACYYASREKPAYNQWRYGSNLARTIVSQHFDLQPQHIVHHVDRNQRNNDPCNLIVFASQADHMRHHHGGKVKPLWESTRARQREDT